MKRSELRNIIKEEIKKVTNEDMATWIDRSNLDDVGSSLVDHIEDVDWYDDDDDDDTISGSDFRTMASKLGTPLNDLKLAMYYTEEGWDSTGDYTKVSKVYSNQHHHPQHSINDIGFSIDKTNGILFFMKNLGGGSSVRGFIFS